MPDPGTDCGGTSGPHTCRQLFGTSDTVDLSVNEGEAFGMLLSLTTTSTAVNGGEIELLADFLSTATLAINAPAGVSVTASPATVPLPASLGLMLAAILGLGLGRARRRAG